MINSKHFTYAVAWLILFSVIGGLIFPNNTYAKNLPINEPTITIISPTDPFLGTTTTFSVSFKNNASAELFGPFLNIFIDKTGEDGLMESGSITEGFDGLGNTAVSVNYGSFALPASDIYTVTLNSLGQAVHPFLKDATGSPVIITAPADFHEGDVMLVVRLPFGSLVPEQPVIQIDVTVDISNYADLGVPLHISAQGGYQFGTTPVDDYATDNPAVTLSAAVSSTITPILMTLQKVNNAPEDQTSTGPNYTRDYTITLNVAPGQTLQNVDVTDVIPENAQYVGPISTSSPASCSTSGTEVPGGSFTCTFAALSGTQTISFPFYIPRVEADNSDVLNPQSGSPVTSCNNVDALGDWAPLDPRDLGSTDNVSAGSAAAPCEDTLNDHSLVVYKSTALTNDVGSVDLGPGDTLTHTLNFDVSDYFAINNIVLTDTISDGQHFDAGFTPTLVINGNTYSLTANDINSANYTVACNYTGAIADGAPCDIANPPDGTGTTVVTFRVSDEIVTRGQDGRMVGGCIDPATGSAEPECTGVGGYNDGPTQGTIVYQTIVQNDFTDDFGVDHTASVDQGDILNNHVVVTGQLLNTADFSTDSMGTPTDPSSTQQVIERGSLRKSIFAVNGAAPGSPVRITAGDQVTYRLEYTLTTSDVEDLYLYDFFPLPIFSVADPDGDNVNNSAPVWTFSSDHSASSDVPAPGEVKFGPTDTFYGYSSLLPVITNTPSQNRVEITYGNYDQAGSQATKIDLLLTATVTDHPFADGLYLTNQAFVNEGSTNATSQDEDALVQLIFTAPSLNIRKSVISTDGIGVLNPDPVGPDGITWDGGSSPRWNGVINSTNYTASTIDSNLEGADAGDLVTFAIVLENTGSGVGGAHDIIVRDTPPANYEYPTPGDGNSIAIQVFNGDGTTSIAYTQSDGSSITDQAAALFGTGIQLTDPDAYGAAQAYDETDGKNIIVITYQMRLATATVAGQSYTNTAYLTHYAAQDDGTNFADPILIDDAQVTTPDPVLVKGLDKTDAVIGEVVTYTLTATVPEGTLPNAHIIDTLPNGLALVAVDSITPSDPSLTFTNTDLGTNTAVTNSGRNVDIDLGNLVNANTNNSAPETLTIVYRAVVLNLIGNQAGTTLANAAALTWDTDPLTAPNPEHTISATPVSLTVREPDPTLTKAVQRVLPSTGTTVDAGDTVEYTLTISNTSAYPAYDLTLTDTLPAALTAPSVYSVTDTAGVLTTADFVFTGNSLALNSGVNIDLPASNGRTITILVRATVVDTIGFITPNNAITNNAQITWTSLDGDIQNLSPYNPDSDERTGADGPGTGLNNYAKATAATINTTAISGTKYLVATSESGTAGNRLTIGEIARYRLIVAIPEGSLADFSMFDVLPAGLRFLNDGTAKAAFVSTSGITSSTISGAGLNLVGSTANSATPTSAEITFILPDSAISTSATTNEDTYASGTDIYFKFGDLTNLSENDADTEYVVVEFNALVENITGNQAFNNSTGAASATSRNNTLNAFINTATTRNSVGITPSSSINIGEPLIYNLAKGVSPATAEAGDTVTYTLTFSNSSAPGSTPAYNVVLTDTLPAVMQLNLASITPTSVSSCAGTPADSSSGNDITLTYTEVPTGCAVTVTYTATLLGSVIPSQTLTNSAKITYTSLPGDYGTTSNATGSSLSSGAGNTPGSAIGERTGQGSVGALNDYLDTAAINVNVTAVAPFKSLVSTTDPNTPTNNLTIGEHGRFRLQVQLSQATSPTFTIQDNLPDGLTYVGNPKVAFVSGTAGSACGSATLTSSTLGSSPWVCGDESNIALVTPTFDLSATYVTGGPFTDSTDPSFALGDLVNTDDDANLEYVVLEFDVLVSNTMANQAGRSVTNTFTVFIAGTDRGDSTGATINVVEPVVTVVKSVSPATPPFNSGDTLSYSLVVTNTSSISAYNVSVQDAPFTSFSFDPANITVSAGVLGTITNNSTASAINITLSEIPAGQVVTIPYTLLLPDTIIVGQTLENTAHISWTSQPSITSDVRTGADGTGGLNDYVNQDDASITIETPAFSKSVSPATATIGDLVTYTITITSPTATIPDLVITDQLPANLIFSGSTPTYSNWPADPVLTYNAGTNLLTWTVGDASGTGDLVVTASPMTITYTAIVADVAANQDGVNITNDAAMAYTDAQSTTQTLDDDATFAVIEPVLAIAKSATPASAVPGSTVHYTMTVSHTAASTATAYDLTISDAIPAGMTYVAGTIGGSSTGSGTVTPNDSADPLTWTIDSLSLGDTATLSFDVTITSNAILGSTINNTAQLTWTSTAGANLNERTAPQSVSDTVNDYADADDADVSIPMLTFAKSVSPENAAIGATVTYTLTVTTPLGTLAGVEIIDELPATLIPTGAYVLGSGWPNTSPVFTSTPPASAGDPTTLSWNFGDMTFSSSPLTITYTAIVANVAANQDDADITNAAALNYLDTSAVPQHLDAQDTFNVIEPVLTIDKSASAASLIPGATVNYTLTVAHDPTSTAPAYDLAISDTLPAGLTYVAGSIGGSTSGSGSITPNDSGNPLTWTISELLAGETATLTYSVDVDNYAAITSNLANNAHLTWTSQPGTNSDERNGADGAGGALNDYADDTAVSLEVTGIDLFVEKDDGIDISSPLSAGDSMTYTIIYGNTGNAAATDVLLTETLPPYTRYSGGSVAWNCDSPADIATRQICTYNLGSLAGGVIGSVTLTVTVTSNLPGGTADNTQLPNNIVIENQEPDDGYDWPDNNRDEDIDTLSTSDDMAVSKAPDHAAGVPYAPGQTIIYTITYTNTGANDQTDVVLHELLPANTTFNASASAAGWTYSDSLSTANGRPTYTYTVGAVAHGGTGTVLFAVDIVDPLPVGITQIDNTVQIHYPAESNDPTPADNSADASVPIDAQFDLSIIKDDGVVQTSPGSSLTYTLTIRNDGNQDVSGVTVVDTLPAGVTFVSASNDGVYDDSTRQITWTIGPLAGETSLTRTLVVTVNDPFDGSNAEIINTAVVSDDGTNGPDPTPDNNTSSDRDLISTSGKTITGTSLADTQQNDIAVGETVSYQVTLDLAPGTTANLKLTDVVDPGLAFIGCTAIQVDDETALALEPGFTLTGICNQAAVSSVPAGSSETIAQGRQMVIDFGNVTNTAATDLHLTVQYDVVVLNVAENADGAQMTNAADWTWDGGELSMTASPLTIVEPELEITKTVNPISVFNGETVTYTLEIRHTADSHANAYNLELTDILPSALTYVPDSLVFVSGQAPTSMIDTAAPTLRIRWDVFNLSTTKTVFTFQARVSLGIPGATITNLASLDWTSLPGQVIDPQSPYNNASVERNYQPNSPVNTYGVTSQADLSIPMLPETGFEAGVRTILPEQPENYQYHAQDDMRLVIRKQNLDLPIVGVPLTKEGWDLTWLNKQIGYLEGTAYPTWDGNTALTAHVYNADGTPGPFVNLHLLRWGDRIELHAFGKIFTYEVRNVERISPYDPSPLEHEDQSTLTLITCQDYNEITGDYNWRIMVQAVLVSVTAAQ